MSMSDTRQFTPAFGLSSVATATDAVGLVGVVDQNGIVRRGGFVPAGALRVPATELHRRVAEVGHQIEPFGEQPQIHAVLVAMAAETCIQIASQARIVIEPEGAVLGGFSRAQDRQVPLLFIDVADVNVGAAAVDDRLEFVAQRLGIGAKQIIRQAVERFFVLMIDHLREGRVVRLVVELP